MQEISLITIILRGSFRQAGIGLVIVSPYPTSSVKIIKQCLRNNFQHINGVMTIDIDTKVSNLNMLAPSPFGKFGPFEVETSERMQLLFVFISRENF